LKVFVRLANSFLLLAMFLIAGCATSSIPESQLPSYSSPWHGRLSLRISPDQGPPQAFSAAFELTGNQQAGELTLYGPLGTTAASMAWSPQSAFMRANGEVRYFGSLNELIKEAVGTELPVNALFAWVAGEGKVASGWRADLSDYPRGRIKASRQEPAPAAELNLILNR
jgi:outer membrane lipoprotein LolB